MIQKLLRPRSQVIIVSSITALIVLYHMLFEWPAATQVRLKHEAFLVSIEEGDNAAWDTLLSESYEDQWGFSKSNAMVAMQDVRSQFIGLKITWKPESEVVDSGDGTLAGEMKFEATGFFATDLITSKLNGIEEPWVFAWKKESWLPWSWKLVRIENSGLDLGGYSPGDLKRQMKK
ncbi:MAG: hypothetical protein O3C21_08765 [Verrucomicrobia bacterium]|nr:hypothetical protein [Verrucomicrobiota bacterium]